jgi:hypothetical protein
MVGHEIGFLLYKLYRFTRTTTEIEASFEVAGKKFLRRQGGDIKLESSAN